MPEAGYACVSSVGSAADRARKLARAPGRDQARPAGAAVHRGRRLQRWLAGRRDASAADASARGCDRAATCGQPTADVACPPPATVPGRCPAGFAALSGPDANPALCYRRLGRPMVITYAAISPAPGFSDQAPYYALNVTLPASDRAALQAITTSAHGRKLAVIVAGQAWVIFEERGALTLGGFQILVSTRRQADELLRILGQPA